MDVTKTKKRPWKTRLERDAMFSKDITDAYLQMGKTYGDIVKKVVDRPKKKKSNKTFAVFTSKEHSYAL